MSAQVIGRDEIDQLTQDGHLDAAQRTFALEIAGINPAATQWHRFLGRLFLFFGVTLLIAAVGYFVAYNWDEMGRFAKIALLEVGVVVAVLAAARFGPDELGGRAALLGAVLLTGPLLAFIGQTYQTGADTYELFRAWAWLALPWVLVARWRTLWCLWLLIANVGVALYFAEAWLPLLGSVFNPLGALVHLLGNALFVVAMEWRGQRHLVGAGRSAERLALAIVIGAATFLYFHFLFESRERAIWQLLVSVGVFVAVWCWYRLRQLDLVALAMWSFAGIGLAVATVGKVLSEGRFESWGFLLLGGTIIGLSAWAASWLRRLHKTAETS